MTEYQAFLLKLNRNLNTLRERESKYGGNAPLELLNQIEDHQQAIALTEQAIRGELSEAEWREALAPLNLSLAQTTNIFQVFIQSIPRRLIVGLGVALLIILGLGIANLEPMRVAMFATATSTITPTPTNTPTPTTTPLPFAPADKDETLILIATFHHTEGMADTDAHNEIRRAIEAAIAELEVKNLRVEVEPTRLTGDDQAEAKKLGERYGASVVIWGADTGVRVTVNFLNLKEPDYGAAAVKISETEYTQLANPSAYAHFITTDLPGQLTFLALYAVGRSYYHRADYLQAIGVIEKAVAALPTQMNPPQGTADAYFDLGWFYGEQAQYDQAIADYTKAIEINHNSLAWPYNNRGIAYFNQGDYQQAIADLTKAIELDSKYVAAYNNRGIAYYNQGDYQQAIADLTKTIELDPKDAATYYNRGTAYYNQDDYQQAIADLTKAIELDPQNADSWNGLCWTGSLAGLATQVMDACDQAVELTPDDGVIRHNRGLARALTGDYQGSIEDFKFFIEWSKQNGLYEQHGRKREAWITELEAGRNPFDEATLEELRKE